MVYIEKEHFKIKCNAEYKNKPFTPFDSLAVRIISAYSQED